MHLILFHLKMLVSVFAWQKNFVYFLKIIGQERINWRYVHSSWALEYWCYNFFVFLLAPIVRGPVGSFTGILPVRDFQLSSWYWNIIPMQCESTIDIISLLLRPMQALVFCSHDQWIQVEPKHCSTAYSELKDSITCAWSLWPCLISVAFAFSHSHGDRTCFVL